MSYTEARSHFEKARLNTVDKGVIEMLDGLKYLTHAIEEDLRLLEQGVRNIRDIPEQQTNPRLFYLTPTLFSVTAFLALTLISAILLSSALSTFYTFGWAVAHRARRAGLV